MGQVFRIGNKCMQLNCSCCRFDNKPRGEGNVHPPLHDGCDCYLVEDRNNKEANMQSVDEGKARLIAKRIAAKMADDPILSCEWNDMSPEQRDGFVHEWTKIASEVLGEEVEPISIAALLTRMCNEQGFANVMQAVSTKWMVEEEGSCIVGPRRSDTVSCSCGGVSDIECQWCCGVGQVTHRVKQAMLEAEIKVDEQTKPPPSEVQTFSMYSSWAEHFIRGMEGLGATKITVPVSPTGSITVEFPKRSQVTIKPIDVKTETEERHDG